MCEGRLRLKPAPRCIFQRKLWFAQRFPVARKGLLDLVAQHVAAGLQLFVATVKRRTDHAVAFLVIFPDIDG